MPGFSSEVFLASGLQKYCFLAPENTVFTPFIRLAISRIKGFQQLSKKKGFISKIFLDI